jgi:hypothetical protein
MTLNPFKRLRERISDLNNTVFEQRGQINYLTLAVEDLQKASRDAAVNIKALAEYEQVKFVTTPYAPPVTKAVAVTQAEIDAERAQAEEYANFRSGFQLSAQQVKQNFTNAAQMWQGLQGGAR